MLVEPFRLLATNQYRSAPDPLRRSDEITLGFGESQFLKFGDYGAFKERLWDAIEEIGQAIFPNCCHKRANTSTPEMTAKRRQVKDHLDGNSKW
jgi:hypothetical protein